MIDVTELLTDPDFVSTYTIWRKSGKWVDGKYEQSEDPLVFYGPVQPPSTEELEQIPEADRVKGTMNFLSTEQIFLTSETGTSDEAEYKGFRYKIIQVKPWHNWYRATGVRI